LEVEMDQTNAFLGKGWSFPPEFDRGTKQGNKKREYA